MVGRIVNGRAWTPQEHARLAKILNRDPDGLAEARHGQLSAVGRDIGRTREAVLQRLYILRKRRRAAG